MITSCTLNTNKPINYMKDWKVQSNDFLSPKEAQRASKKTFDWLKTATIKMAGQQVETRINDKFYFVLDEVGDSSECESELTSENNPKLRKSPIQRISGLVCNDIEKVSSIKNSIETRNEIQNINDMTDSLNNDEINSHSEPRSPINEKREINSERAHSPPKKMRKMDSESEETSAVVDMEIDSDVDSPELSKKPLLRVTFRDEDVEKSLKNSLVRFFSQRIKKCTIITNSENSLEMEVYDKDPKKLLENDLLEFNLDTTPGDDLDIPNYGRSHDLILSDINVEMSDANLKTTTSCFNCLGNHNLRDCPEVKDFRVINENRLKFQNKNNQKSQRSRYHLDENQKFSHITPGVFSKQLRNALNLRRDQQPGFIYKMRLLGYPPAWLEEAKVSHSGVAMYDGIGIPVLEEDEEEGEILPEGSKDKFDLTKIIEFPGFNVPLPNNFKDETRYYSCPPFSEDQSKDTLIKILQPKTVQAYVKKSLNTSKLSDEKLDEVEKNESERQQSSKRLASPTIEEMEEKKKQLLMELNGEESTSDSKLNSEDSSSAQGTSETEVSQKNLNKDVGNVKNSEFGTPILKSVSPFSKLPSREQFSVNVSDVINFENLPDSTGKYETMRHLITKIRLSASKTQSE